MTPPLSTERVLSTLNADGTRHWIRPKLARGRFLRRRRITAYALIALFVALPFIEIGGRPALLIDLVSREVSLFGGVYRPTDGFILMLVGLVIVVGVFLATALFGRVWCGWACPQTVYLEHVFRPIERWLEGTPAQQAKLPRFHARRLIKWAIYAALAFALGNTFLAYFVGVARLKLWVIGSPFDHPIGFAVVFATWLLVMVDFTYFREQTCIVACPYGRLQATMLDRQSLIVGYDERRGEPRGQPRRKLPVVGDCVDCSACVAVCPTGIDIRAGLQMECIACAQCIDACDTVMDRLGKPRGLIAYTSQDKLAGKPGKLLRARTIIYPLLLALGVTVLVTSVASREAAEVAVERPEGPSFVELPGGMVSAQARIRIENTTDARHHYSISIHASTPGATELTLRSQAIWDLDARKSTSVPVFIDAPRASFAGGKRDVYLAIADDAGFHRIVSVTLLGPVGGAR